MHFKSVRLLMLTNTFLPHVGGVARSVERVSVALRGLGHEVRIVAPEFPGIDKSSESERDIIRVPALQNFNGSDFSVRLPLPGLLDDMMAAYKPDLLHAHHPFLLGDTAVRLASRYGLPLIFTHHTLYERYTHYVGSRSPALKRFASQLSTEFANLCDHVLAPSESVRRLIKRRGVKSPIRVIPTGIDRESFDVAADPGFRQAQGIPEKALLVGHLGRLAAEKNLAFLGKALARFLRDEARAYVLIAGQGPMESRLRRLFKAAKVENRVRYLGVLRGKAVAQAYAAMDLFAFASRTETQGMVLAEAMAVGTPVLAIDAPGVREIVINGKNGLLLPGQHADAYVEALKLFASFPSEKRAGYRREARATAGLFALDRTILELEAVYKAILEGYRARQADSDEDAGGFPLLLRRIHAEWKLLAAKASAAGSALNG